MAIEIERKFLLSSEDWRSGVTRSTPIRQVYLGGQGVSVRVRLEGDHANINIKEHRLGFKRAEFEYPVPVADALAMAELAAGPGISKIRHLVPFAGMTWEIDEFEDLNQGLIVAEIELEREDQEFGMPSWAGREVTDVERYYNVALARRPFLEWSVE